MGASKALHQIDWFTEWNTTIEKEKRFLQHQAKQDSSALNALLESHIPDKLQETLDTAFSKAFAVLFEKGVGVIEATYGKKKVRRAFTQKQEAVKRTRAGRSALRAVSDGTAAAGGRNLVISGVEGIGLGILGIGIPDIPLFSGMLLRSLYEISSGYGFSYDGEKEQLFQLKLIEAAFSHGEALESANQALDHYIGLHTWDEGESVKKQLPKTAACLSGELLYMKFLQGIPIAGAVGGAYDIVYLKRLQKFARLKYYKRYLLREKNNPRFYRLTKDDTTPEDLLPLSLGAYTGPKTDD